MKTKTLKAKSRLGVLLLAFVLIAGLFTVGAAAADVTTFTAQLRPNVTILVDGTARTFYNAQGQEAHAIYADGTHYLPLRAIGELMGKNVNWDQTTLTVSLSGTRTAGAVQGTPDTTTQTQSVSVQSRPDFTIMVDGVKKTFADAQGRTVYPLLYNGTTYLPVRAVGELMGKTVSWNEQTATITLAASAGNLVTDADSFGQNTNTTAPTTPVTPPQAITGATQQAGTQTGARISVETAKSKALAHAGLAADQVTFVQQKLDWDDGRLVYEIEFYTADYKEYDYEIDATTGAVISYDYDAEYYARPTTPTNTNGSYIGVEKAKSIALGNAGLTANKASRLRCWLERDDGRWQYNVEFYYNTMEYDYEIDAYTGTILSRDVDSIYD